MKKEEVIMIKVFTFLILFFIISVIPIFIKLSVTEEDNSAQNIDEIHYKRTYDQSNFYRAISKNGFENENMPPYSVALVMNLLLMIVYTQVVYFTISILGFSQIPITTRKQVPGIFTNKTSPARQISPQKTNPSKLIQRPIQRTTIPKRMPASRPINRIK